MPALDDAEALMGILWDPDVVEQKQVTLREPLGGLDLALKNTNDMLTYVNFSGKCAEAFRFYEKHLGGKIGMMMTQGQGPDQSQVNRDWKDAILHALVSIGGTELMGADIPSAQPMRSAYLSLSIAMARRSASPGGLFDFGAPGNAATTTA